MPLCPESPRYLLIKKNDEDAAKKGEILIILGKLRNGADLEEAFIAFVSGIVVVILLMVGCLLPPAEY